MNMTLGSPTNLWCDAVMFEGGTGIDYPTVEGVKIYRTTMCGWYYVWQYRNEFGAQAVEMLKYNIKRNLSYGVCIGLGDVGSLLDHPDLAAMTDLYRVASGLTALPLVIENDVLGIEGVNFHSIKGPEVSGCVFAKDGVLYVLIFNDKPQATQVKAKVNKKNLEFYRSEKSPLPRQAYVFDNECHLEKVSAFKVDETDQSFIIAGTLGRHELAVFTNQEVGLGHP
jgi:hypothetical protein